MELEVQYISKTRLMENKSSFLCWTVLKMKHSFFVVYGVTGKTGGTAGSWGTKNTVCAYKFVPNKKLYLHVVQAVMIPLM